jgi:hypothetical protein
MVGSDVEDPEPEQNQLSLALQRVADVTGSVDPQSCVARFGSAFP